MLVRLPEIPRIHFQGGQPPATVAEGVDALQEAEVEDFSVLLGRVADNDSSARVMRGGPRYLEFFPEQGPPGLLVHWQFWPAARVDEA